MRFIAKTIPVLLVLLVFVPSPIDGRPGRGEWPADFDSRARKHVEALVAIGPRQAGSPGEGRAADYIAGRFREIGLSACIEPFDFEVFEPAAVALTIGAHRITPASLGLDPYAGPLGYSGPFVVLDPAAPSAWPSPAEVEGKAAVTSEAGAPSLHFRIAGLRPRCIIDLGPADLERVRGLKALGLTLSVQGGLLKGTSRNVVARLGQAPPATQILVGAHMDAYRENPGANDNASGVAALLELAGYLKRFVTSAGVGVTFVAFGAEECGLLGSRQFVERHAVELASCRLAFVLDDLGGEGPVLVERDGGRPAPTRSPESDRIPPAYRGRAWEGLRYPWRLLPPAELSAAFGTSDHPGWLVEVIDDAVRLIGFDVRFTGPQGSDQISFAQAGIATSGIGVPNSQSHTPDDKPATVDFTRVAQCAEVAGRIILNARDRLTGADPMADVRFLASDELRGRRAGSREGDIAGRYIAERLRVAGVETLPTAPGYFQDVVWERKDSPPPSPAGTPRMPLRARNVIGVIPGGNRELAGQFVLLMAHYDHLGARTLDGAEIVFNGARDNAMGVAALLKAAEALALKPAARSVLILATTAEEDGLIGSRFFVNHPLVPLSRIAFVLNNDGAGVYEPGLWCLGGLERTTAGPLAEAAGRAHGLVTQPYPEKYRHLFAEGDAFAFVEIGIPSLTVSPGFAEGQEELIAVRIHKPADRVDADFDATYLRRFCLAYADLARAVADARVAIFFRCRE